MPEIIRWMLISVMLAFGLYAVRQLVRGVSTGTVESGDLVWPTVSKASQPRMFWFYILGWGFGAISGLGLGGFLLFDPTAYLDLVT